MSEKRSKQNRVKAVFKYNMQDASKKFHPDCLAVRDLGKSKMRRLLLCCVRHRKLPELVLKDV